MPDLLQRISSFRGDVFPSHAALYRKLAREGQQPQALMISCVDSRVLPEAITRSGPGELFVCRNAGNIVPPFSTANGGVSSAIEYAVVALGVLHSLLPWQQQTGHGKDRSQRPPFHGPSRRADHCLEEIGHAPSFATPRGRNASLVFIEQLKREPPKVVAVALVKRIAMIAWKMMMAGETYRTMPRDRL